MIRLVCVVEIEDATTVAEAQQRLDAFREAVQPNDYGLSIYRAPAEAAGDDTRYPVAYELDAAGEATTAHYYCSPACRAAAARPDLLADGYDETTVDGLHCEHCDRPLA